MTRTLALIALLLAACNQPVDPATPDYPCGPRGRECSSGGCCLSVEVCGGDDPSCRPGMCCYVGSLGAPQERKQGR